MIQLKIADRIFNSRLFLGTGKFSSIETMKKALIILIVAIVGCNTIEQEIETSMYGLALSEYNLGQAQGVDNLLETMILIGGTFTDSNRYEAIEVLALKNQQDSLAAANRLEFLK